MTFSPPIAFSSASWPRASCSEVVGRFLGSLDWQGKLADSVSSPRSMVLTGAPRLPGFPVEIDGFSEIHAAFREESRTRGFVPEPRNRKSGFAQAYLGRKRCFSNAFTPCARALTRPNSILPQSRSVGRGCAPSFSAHVRCGEHGAPVQGVGFVVCSGPVVKTENR
jgi:hypothetical protein